MLLGYWFRYAIYFRYGLHVAAIALIVAFVIMGRRRLCALRVLLAAALLGLACLAVCNYTNFFHWRHGTYLNAYEFYHYYLGGKYAREIGYTGLYGASLAADEETKLKYNDKRKFVRNLDTGRYIGYKRVLRMKAKYKALFSEARWKEFVRDIVYFKKKLNRRRWNSVLRDKGFNGTPVWSMAAGTLANHVPTDSARGMMSLALLDALLILCATGCVWWAFDHRAALLWVTFLGTCLLMDHSHMKGAFLRTDWAMCLVMAVCMLKKEHYAIAGSLTAYAALSRVFPAIFAFGIGAKFALELLGRRTVNRRHLAYLASFGATVAVLVLASIVYAGGLDSWREFAGKIAYHNKSISDWRVGFKYIFMMAYRRQPPGTSSHGLFFDEWRIVWWSIQVFVLALSVFLVRKLDDHEAMSYGFVPVFFLVAPTYYYYIMLLVPFLFFACKLERPTRALGLIMLFAMSMVAWKLYPGWGRGYAFFFTVSCMLLGIVFYMMELALVVSLGKTPPEPEDEEPAASLGSEGDAGTAHDPLPSVLEE